MAYSVCLTYDGLFTLFHISLSLSLVLNYILTAVLYVMITLCQVYLLTVLKGLKNRHAAGTIIFNSYNSNSLVV